MMTLRSNVPDEQTENAGAESRFALQEIVSHSEEQTCPVSERLKLFYCSHLPPRWIIQVVSLLRSLVSLNNPSRLFLPGFTHLRFWA